MKSKVTVLPGQSLVDIAIQEYGKAEGVIDLLRENKLLEQQNQLVPGTVLQVVKKPRNVLIAKWFRAYRVVVASAAHVVLESAMVSKVIKTLAGGNVKLLSGGKIKLLNE
jgi:hypothetical protein